jgi:hypothetical protein
LGDWGEVIRRVSGALRRAIQGRVAGDAQAALLPSVSEPAMAPPSEIGRAAHLSRVAESRYGILQYSPCQRMLAQSLDWYGEWLQPQLDLLAAFLRPGAVVVEAASGIGAHALALARIIGPTGHLLSYEADRILLRMLAQNLQMNQVRSLVTIMPRRLAGLIPSVQFEIDIKTFADASSRDETAPANLDTIDDLGLARLDLLKINDPHAVSRILEGGVETLWRLRPVLFLAATDGEALDQSARRVRDFGYRCWRSETPVFNPRNFNRREADVLDRRVELALVAIPEERDAGALLDACVEMW